MTVSAFPAKGLLVWHLYIKSKIKNSPGDDCFGDLVGCRKKRAQPDDRNFVSIVERYPSLVDLKLRSHVWLVRILLEEVIGMS